jgi:type I restriction enzyme, S subunit
MNSTTNLCALPSSWKTLEVNSCFELQNGINFSADQKGSGLLVVDVLNMFSNDLYVRTDRLYRVDIEVSKERLLQPGDILFVRSSVKQTGIGWPAIFRGHDEPVTNCGFLIRARQISNELDPKFVVHYLRQVHVRSQMISRAGTVAITNINQERLGSLKIPLPPIAQQKRIAAILDQAEALRSHRREAIGLLDELGRSVFLEMFGDPGKNLMGWEASKLEAITEKITDGEHQTPKRTTEGIKLLSARNIQDGCIDVEDVDYISTEEYERIKKRCNPVRGDILISCSGTIGRVTLVDTDEPFSLVRSVALIKPVHAVINSKFLECFLRTSALRARMQQRANASSQANLFQNQIRELPAILPPLPLQQQFAQRIAAIEALKTTQKEALSQLDALFASLQHRAFRGEL